MCVAQLMSACSAMMIGMPRQCFGPNHPRGELLPDEKFQIKGSTGGRVQTPGLRRAKVCKDCQITLNMAKREAEPYKHAFESRRKNHASRLSIGVAELVRLGWDTELRALEMEIQHKHGYCPMCPYRNDGVPTLNFYRDMGRPVGDLAELTIDIFDPVREPRWPGNVWWVCSSCNKRMQREGKFSFAERLLAEHAFRVQEAQPPAPITLF
jgi:hypothetical protein